MLVRAALLVADPFRKACACSPSIPSWAWSILGHCYTTEQRLAAQNLPPGTSSSVSVLVSEEEGNTGRSAAIQDPPCKPVSTNTSTVLSSRVLHTAPQKQTNKKKAGIKSMNETLWMSAVGICLLQL